MFDSVLIANRGEIALRIWRACKALGLKTVAVYSEADAELPHVKLADQAICIGPAQVKKSYLDIDEIIFVANLLDVGAIHPGYGLLSENALFAEKIEKSGRVFIGPSSSAILNMGDKIRAKEIMISAGVPCIPGSAGALPDNDFEIKKIAEQVGYPLIIKAAGGGGGRGMKIVHAPEDLISSVNMTREEARNAFNNPELYLEKFLENPRHIEIQVLADMHGNVVCLGERDCSTQRRHQKLIEEAPAPGISRSQIATLGEFCIRACKKINYSGAGTFEFLYEKGDFYFIEMNTRVQVEHPVTEMITGVDIVKEQLLIALGKPLSIKQEDVNLNGHAIECRINAENPWSFKPSAGVINSLHLPGGPGIRVETHVSSGFRISPHYDSMIAKFIAYGPTREDAIARMRVALLESKVYSIDTTIDLHKALMDSVEFNAGEMNIHYLQKLLDSNSLKKGVI